jgi:hypothetical protein
VYGTIEELAAAEKINASYVGRLLRLTLLAPDIVEAVLDERQPTEMTLAMLMRPLTVVWQDQKRVSLDGCHHSVSAIPAMLSGSFSNRVASDIALRTSSGNKPRCSKKL